MISGEERIRLCREMQAKRGKFKRTNKIEKYEETPQTEEDKLSDFLLDLPYYEGETEETKIRDYIIMNLDFNQNQLQEKNISKKEFNIKIKELLELAESELSHLI